MQVVIFKKTACIHVVDLKTENGKCKLTLSKVQHSITVFRKYERSIYHIFFSAYGDLSVHTDELLPDE